MASRTVDSPESRSGMARPWRRHRARINASCSPDQPSGDTIWALAIPTERAEQVRGTAGSCTELRQAFQVQWSAGCTQGRARQVGRLERPGRGARGKHSSSFGGGGVSDRGGFLAGGSFVEAELTESGDRGARTARFGVAEREACDMGLCLGMGCAPNTNLLTPMSAGVCESG